MLREKRREGKGERRCVYLDLQLGRNSRRLLSDDDMKRRKKIEKKKYKKMEEDRGQHEADAEDCIGTV